MNSFNLHYWFFFQLNDFLKGEFQSRLLQYKEKKSERFQRLVDKDRERL